MIADVNTKNILATDFCHGRTHDVQLLKERRCAMSPKGLLLADAGYQGLADIHANRRHMPAKKSTLHPLTNAQQASNRALSRQRIVIENILRTLKIFRLLSERYRKRRKRFGLRFNLIAAIYNMELKNVK